MYRHMITVILLMLFSKNGFSGWSLSSGVVTRVYSHYGAHVIRTSLTDNVCTPGGFWWPADSPDAKDMFALATSALLADKKIQVVYNPDALDCQYGGSAKITHMGLIK